ncbi:MAG TPA: FAD-dependent oxidoreductase [Candidatus Heimdallarchaeota archaeon]|nr:FAD-dependent oxidoreductase [Candidatus Heimdallarchaeota archaeon]
MMTVTIDGKAFTCQDGEMILEVARRAGIEIPALCAEKRLAPFDSCGVCVVEVEGKGVVKSCSTPVEDGMVILPHSPEAEDVRRAVLELLLSNHWGDCIGPCQQACPAHTDCQGYVCLAGNGLFREALEHLYNYLPFPASFGRICPAPCEDACRRQIVEEPIQIRHMKRFLGDQGLDYVPSVAADSGFRVAIVGGGPAGLSCAYFLQRQGHAAVVFEAMPKMGGMLRYGIPDYRLPQDVLDWELSVLQRMGIEFRNGVRLGGDLSCEQLEKQYDAVFLGLGAWASGGLGVPGEDHPAVRQGTDFLCHVNQGERPTLPEHVAVIGGGNTAMDAARTARRLGAQVTVLYRRSREQMPALPREINEAEEEGVTFNFLVQPVEFLTNGEQLSGIKCVKMQLGGLDASGRARPVPIEGSEFVVPVQATILAVGQLPDTTCLSGAEIEVDRRGRIIADEATGQTSRTKVFTGGDVVTGPSIAVEAVGAGRRAADAIDQFLRGVEVDPPFVYTHEKMDVMRVDIGDVEEVPRVVTPVRVPEERTADFDEYETDFTPEQAIAEGARCLGCGCTVFNDCALRDYSAASRAQQASYAGELDRKRPDERHPFIIRDLGKCIACGRCIRVCGEVCGIHAIDFVGRGISQEVQAPFDRPWQESACVSCGACVDTCPTGALADRSTLEKQVPLDLTETPSVCTLCGLTCEINVLSLNGRYMKTLPRHEEGILCAKGRYGWHTITEAQRVTAPLLREGSKWAETSWEDAFRVIAERLPRGENETVVIGSGHLTNEEGYLLARLGREGLHTTLFAIGDVMSRESVVLPGDALASTVAIDTADLIIVVGPRSRYERFVLDLRLRTAKKAGAIIIGLQADLPEADVAIEELPAAGLMGALSQPDPEVDDRLVAIKERISSATHPLLVFEERTVSADAVRAIARLVEIQPAWKVAMVRALPNTNGLAKVGFQLDGKDLALDTARACLVVGTNPAQEDSVAAKLKQMNFVVTMAVVNNETTAQSDVVLPMSLPIETNGHLIDTDGNPKQLTSILRSPAGEENWEILVSLAQALDLHWDYADVNAVTSAIEAQTKRRSFPEEYGCQLGGERGGLAAKIEDALSALNV